MAWNAYRGDDLNQPKAYWVEGKSALWTDWNWMSSQVVQHPLPMWIHCCHLSGMTYFIDLYSGDHFTYDELMASRPELQVAHQA